MPFTLPYRLENWEKQAIIGFHLKNPFEGYRRLTFMMLGRRHAGGESVQRLAGIGASRTLIEVERKALEERQGF